MDGWLQFPRARPRRAASGGVPARSRRGGFGESWWSRRFIEVLESLSIASRLSRGRSYARSGQVSALEVSASWVTARVQGSARTPYEVWIQVPRLSDAQWDRVEGVLAGQASLVAALLGGEMPGDIEQAFAAAGVSLFPSSAGELAMECSCPDYAVPCKHVAATFYLLAEAFDRDPFLIFAWRGRDRSSLLARLRERRGMLTEPGDREDAGPAARAAHLPVSPAEFWTGGATTLELRFDPRAPEVPDAQVLSMQPAPLYPDGHDPTPYLSAAYTALTRAAERRARGVAGEEHPATDPASVGGR